MNKFIEINDFNDEKLDIYARLNEAQLLHYYEPNGGIFIAETPMVISRALDKGLIPISFLVDERVLNSIEVQELLSRCNDVDVFYASLDVLNSLTGFNLTRGVLCSFKRDRNATLEELINSARRIAVLEEVMNPTNVGAIFRSAAALNVDAIVLTSGSSNPYYRRAARVSMGCSFQIPWTIVDNNSTWIDILHNNGFKIASMALHDNSVDINNEELNSQEKLAIVFGSESTGLIQRTIDASDYVIKIPMSHGVDSLNVAAASAVAFWQLCCNN